MAATLFDASGHKITSDTQAAPFNSMSGQWGGYADWETSPNGSCLVLCPRI